MDGLSHFLKDRQRLSEFTSGTAASALQPLFDRAATLADELREGRPLAQREIFLDILRRTVIAQDSITLRLSTAALRGRIGLGSADDDEDIQVTFPITIRRRGVETRLVIEEPIAPAKPDAKLVELVVQAHCWFNALKGCTNVGLQDLGKRYGADPSDISSILPLAFLAPDIVEAILDGRQPPELTAARLKRMRDLPLD